MGQLDYAAKDYRAAAGYYERALAAYPATSIAKTLGAIRLYQLNDRAGRAPRSPARWRWPRPAIPTCRTYKR